jgi:hypothetical protein
VIWRALAILALIGATASAREAAGILRAAGWNKLPPGFQMIALSHLADGCRDRRDADCLSEVGARAHKLAPDPTTLVDRGEGLLATHLNLILDDLDELSVAHDESAHAALVARLAQRSTPIVSSYATVAYRWPADQSATLASLARYDRLHGTHHLTQPLANYRALVAAHSSTRWSLPWSEATGHAPHAKLPRGCAIAFSVRYLAEADADLARSWWRAFLKHYFADRVLVAGFREWPPGTKIPADPDSGPIEAGIGAAATAFGLLAARALGDSITWARLVETARAVGAVASLSPALRSARDSPLAEAILFAAGL